MGFRSTQHAVLCCVSRGAGLHEQMNNYSQGFRVLDLGFWVLGLGVCIRFVNSHSMEKSRRKDHGMSFSLIPQPPNLKP